MGSPASWRQRINAVLNGAAAFRILYQPICRLNDARDVVGYEALSRFDPVEHLRPEEQTPDVWFHEAAEAGLGPELEALAVACAIQAAPLVTPRYVSVNVSADTILVPEFGSLVMGAIPEHIVVELTEHEVVRELTALKQALAVLRGMEPLAVVGVKVGPESARRVARLAIDDVGAGHSGLSRIIDLAPDVLKLDRSLVAGIDTNHIQAAVVSGMVLIAAAVGIALVAEGIETEEEFAALRALGVDYGQGWLLGRPAPMEGVKTCSGPL